MKNLLLTSLFTLICVTTIGQVDFNKIVPKTPEAASMIQYGDNPVDEYTGIPKISIPIYTLAEGNISVPISLSYNAGGIKLSQEASTVGLGWTINAGGAITRSLGGIDDFHAYFNGTNKMPDIPLNYGIFNPDGDQFVENDGYCKFWVDGVLTSIAMPSTSAYYSYDNQSDTYHYNFNGHSGSYVLDRNGDAHLSDKKGVSIKLNSLVANSSTWDIVTENGTRYKFTKKQQTYLPNIASNNGNYYSSWFLTQIVGVNGEVIDLIYADKNELEPLKSFTQAYMTNLDYIISSVQQGTHTYLNNVGPTTTIDGVYLTEIRSSNGKVKFNYSADGDRNDLQGSYSLNSIQVFRTVNEIDEEIKNFDFDYSYFGNVLNPTSLPNIENGDYATAISPLSTNHSFNNNQSINARLKLDAVTENSIKTHSFEYDNGIGDIPNKTSFSQDYWGYYNGQTNEDYFIPPTSGIPNQADRAPRENFAKTFSLNKITYPTGGFTILNYELNTYEVTSTFNALPVGTIPKSASLTNGTNDPEYVELEFTTGNIDPESQATYEIHLAIYDYDHNIYSSFPCNYGSWPDMYGELQDSNGTRIAALPLPQCNYNYGTFASIEDVSITLNSNSTYKLVVNFDKKNGAMYGQAWIKVDWTEIDNSSSNQDFAIGGGLRVKTITNYDNDNTPLLKKTYNYHYTENINNEDIEKSYGRLKTIPNYEVDHIVLMKVVSTVSFGLGSFALPAYQYSMEPIPTVIGSSGSSNSFSTDNGSYVGYDQVSISQEDFSGNKNGETIFKFYNTEDLFQVNTYYEDADDYISYPPIRVPTNGLLYEKESYKINGATSTLVNKIENKYKANNSDAATFTLIDLYQNSDYVIAASKELPNLGGTVISCDDFQFQFYPHYSNIVQQTSTKETNYDLNGLNPVVTEQNFYYDNNDKHFERTRTEITDSKGNTLETKIYYPDDILDRYDLNEGGDLTATEYTQIDKLKADDLHRINTPIQTVTKKASQVLSIQRNLFATNGNIVLPSITQTAKGSTNVVDRLMYEDYEDGKPIHISKKDGTDISYIWGYNDQYPIAKIVNLAYSAIPIATINDLKDSSNDDNDNCTSVACKEEILRDQLDDLRSDFPNAMITTFTYDPLVGVTSITDPKGYTIYYSYDDLNRLEFIKDAEGKIVSNTNYHYKGQ